MAFFQRHLAVFQKLTHLSCRHGGITGHENVNDMKALVHAQAGQNKLQSSIAGSILGGKEVSGKNAKAVAAAAAEIAKILSAPSAREIVLGQPSPRADLSSADPREPSSSSSSGSGDGGHVKLATWLKTPKDEGKFSYTHRAKNIGMAPCATR